MIDTEYISKKSERNKLFCDRIRNLANKYSIIGVVDIVNLPAPQFQRIRGSLNKNSQTLIVKKNLIKLVLSELESKFSGISKLVETITGMPGLIFTNDNPFLLFKSIKKNKSPAPAKAGQIAPNDIIVPAGPTNFVPGPIIGELGALKIKAGITAGKVEIKEDSLVAKEGQEISAKLAGVLSRLGIEPMEVGLNVKGIYEDGIIFKKEILDVDEKQFLADMVSCANNAYLLSIGINYFTKDNIVSTISKVSRESIGLGVEIAYPATETIKLLIAKANMCAGNVSLVLPKDIRPAEFNISVVEDNISTNEEPNDKKIEKESEEDVSSDLGSFF